MSDLDAAGDSVVPVLITGCGPTGMTAALALSQLGVPSMVLDKRRAVAQAPRAHALNCRTLEIFAALGVDMAALREVATPDAESGWVRWVDTLDGGEFGALPYERIPSPETVPTPFPLFNIAQPDAEAVLFEQVQRDPNIRVERGWEWQSCEQHAGGVTSRVVDGAGASVQIESRFLIAADGANSPVRCSQGIAMQGAGVVQRFKNVHFRADLSAIAAAKPAILYWVLKQSCTGTLIAYNMRNNWVFMYPQDAVAGEGVELTDERCIEAAREAIGDPTIELDIVSVGDWEMTSEVAERYRQGAIFLAGDAAHRYPPSGGLGLNTGVGDAHNLAWKIAGVLDGWAPAELLDTYESERRPVANHNADFSLENAMKMLDVFDHAGVFGEPGTQPDLASLRQDRERWDKLQVSIEQQRGHFDGLALHLGAHYGRDGAPELFAERVQHAEVGARLPHVWLQRGAQRVSSHTLLSSGEFTLLAGPGVDTATFSLDSPLRVLSCPGDFTGDDAALDELGLSAGAVLVRPDGHIAALLADSAGLDDAIARVVRTGLAA